jgi:hypothetical protein
VCVLVANGRRLRLRRECIGVNLQIIQGNPDPKYVSTSYVIADIVTLIEEAEMLVPAAQSK